MKKMSLQGVLSERPITTLFMLMSADGKISTGSTDALDFDKDLPNIKGASKGLRQYYEIEKTTDLWSFGSGKVQVKIGVNDKMPGEKTPVSFVIVDNKHLDTRGVEYLCSIAKTLVIVTTNPRHPAFLVEADNLYIRVQNKLDLRSTLVWLKSKHGCENLTLQTGGTLNGLFLREKLIDYLDVVIAPILVGGKDTLTLIDGAPLKAEDELSKLGVLELKDFQMLEGSYLRLRYRVVG